MTDVVSVPDEGDVGIGEHEAALVQGQQVRERLAGVVAIAEGIHHRNVAVIREFFEDLMPVHPSRHCVEPSF